jgi:hypothetical protein
VGEVILDDAMRVAAVEVVATGAIEIQIDQRAKGPKGIPDRSGAIG